MSNMKQIAECITVQQFPATRKLRNFDKHAWSNAHGLECKDPSRTIQSQKDEADINTIVRNFGVTGVLPVGVKVPQYGDFTGMGDYRDCLEAVRAAEASFAQLPASLRRELDDDPGRFVEWAADEKNLPKMRELGLAVPLKEEPKKE